MSTDPTINHFVRAFSLPSAEDLAPLHDRLANTAVSDGLLDLAYRTLDSPFGNLLIAATPIGLVRLAFERENHERVLADLAVAISPRMLQSGQRTDHIARQLDEYFAGERQMFDVATDLRLVDGFRRIVIANLAAIGYGETTSYATVAIRAGSPKAVRAVGSACAHNPVPIVIPCHRVVRSDGSIGQYLGGIETKAALLALEAAA